MSRSVGLSGSDYHKDILNYCLCPMRVPSYGKYHGSTDNLSNENQKLNREYLKKWFLLQKPSRLMMCWLLRWAGMEFHVKVFCNTVCVELLLIEVETPHIYTWVANNFSMKGLLPQVGESALRMMCVNRVFKHNNAVNTPTLGNGKNGKLWCTTRWTRYHQFRNSPTGRGWQCPAEIT